MSLKHHALQIACLVSVLGSRVGADSYVGPGRTHGSAPTTAVSVTSTLPVIAEHKYRMLAKVRPLLFWISKDDVGGARSSWRGDDHGGFGPVLVILAARRRAPRKIT